MDAGAAVSAHPIQAEMWGRVALKSIGRQCGGELQGVQRAAHLASQSVVDHLVLLDTAFAFERCANDMRRPMIVVANEVFQLDLGIGELGLDQTLDLGPRHGHLNSTPDWVLRLAASLSLCLARSVEARLAISISYLILTQTRLDVIEPDHYVFDQEHCVPNVLMEDIMKTWTKPAVREQEVGLEVTSYLPAEIDLI
jgi:coenzyme PQQ precursor peptide PqqA